MKVSGPIPSHFSYRDVFRPAFSACWACLFVVCAHGLCEAQAASPTQTTLNLSSSSVLVGTTVTLAADVTSSGVPVSPGLVLFCNADAPKCVDAAVLGQVQLTNHGVASIPLRLGIGTYNIKAVFQGVARTSSHSTVLRQSSKSAAQKLTVESPSKVASTTALNVTGGSGSYQFTSSILTPARPIPGGTLSLLDLAHFGASLGSLPLSAGTRSVNLFHSYPVPNPDVFNIMQMASGDFNRDGIPDLVVTYDNQAVTVLLGKGDGTFTGGAAPQISSGNQAVAVGDFNGDGIPDLAVGQFGNTSPCCTVSILPGVGDGTFGAPINFQMNDSVSLLLVGDFDRDGILDLAVVNGAGSSITLEFGNGDGSFGDAKTIALNGDALGADDERNVPPVLISDFNGDGVLDIAALISGPSAGQSTVELLIGVGDGTFTARSIPLSQKYCGGLAAADFNGDGHTDLAVASGGEQTVTTLLGDGMGGFTPLAPQKVNNFTGRLATADFNNDGIPDLVVIGVLLTDPLTFNTLGGVSFFFGVGDGTFVQSNSAIAAPLGENVGYTAVPTIADFNGDGVPDIATDYSNEMLADVFLNQPETSVTLPASLPGGGRHSVEASYSGDTVYQASSSAAVGVQNLTATPLLFPASGDYTSPVQITITDATPGAVIHYTINPFGNSSGTPGKPILYTGPFLLDEGSALPDNAEVVAKATAPGYLPSGNAFEAYGVPASTQVRLGFAPYASNLAGIRVSMAAYVTANGVAFHDGIVVFCNADAAHCEDSAILGSRRLVPGGWSILRRRFGPGTYHIRAEFQGQPRNGRGPSSSPAETLISLGKAATVTGPVEVVHTAATYTFRSQITVYGVGPLGGAVSFKDSINGALPVVLGSAALTATNATVGLTATPASNTGGAPSTFAVADFDRDGISDLVTGNTTENTLSILHGNADATFTARSTIPVAVPPTLVTTGDLNGDDLQDLVVTSRSTNTISILLGKLDGSFTTGATLATGAGPQGTVIADLNGDGFPDIATADTDSGMVSIFVGDGHGNFPSYPNTFNFSVPGKPVSMVVADFNKDGLLDIATSNLDGTVTVLLGGSATLASLQFSTASTLNPDGHGLIATGDFNGDGIPDLAVPTASAIAIYLGKGDGTFTLKGSVPASDVQSVEVADFNGDNLSDLVVTKTTGTQSSVILFFGAGDGAFPRSTTPKATSFSASTVTGDFNGDSIPDLAALDLSNNTVGVLLGEQNIIGAIHGIVLSTPGAHTISAIYSGFDTFAGSAGQPLTINIPKPATASSSLKAHD
jgi:VCBS repeat protein/Big-like domain-containing protein/chitobiase/beta-hexosaminidase-like protein